MATVSEPLMVGDEDIEGKPTLIKRLLAKSKPHHERIPYLRRLPLPAIAIVALLVVVNLAVWVAAGIILHFHKSLISTAVLSYTLGLRHALDADHISAIDVMTRRLVAAGQRPVTVGTFFSLGHSTIVIITCLVVASTAAAISDRFGSFGTVGGIIGSTVSAVFLIVLGAINIYILVRLVQELRFYLSTPPETPYPHFSSNPLIIPGPTDADGNQQQQEIHVHGHGPILRWLSRLFKLIDRPWKMYPLGVLFGLGFDTSSEIALLGIAAISSTRGLSIWLILIFPVLFTAGMCLLDTLDGALMMSLYTSTRLAGDRVAVCYYQVVLTGITVLVAVVIGVLQVLNMVVAVAEPKGRFWEGVEVVGDHYDIIGGAICGAFVVFGGAAAILYKPWRRRVDAQRKRLIVESPDDDVPHGGEGIVTAVSSKHVCPGAAEQTENEGQTKKGPKASEEEVLDDRQGREEERA
ncbi:high-affinity nickel-transport protein-domain-containing protein [Elsinoe ampelina]|uniref:Nickel/cobalt efflux system n=1 Tax=Elsinoe ampelina TaxID=302913 RepID=A0A6A6FZL3_9PEZI|nr:high-affinity nickel-transport protein-domain-containing protein [Elsinoe ampelina]